MKRYALGLAFSLLILGAVSTRPAPQISAEMSRTAIKRVHTHSNPSTMKPRHCSFGRESGLGEFVPHDLTMGPALAVGEVWARRYGGGGVDRVREFDLTADGGMIIAGYTAGSFSAGMTYDAWVLKLDRTGGIEWQKRYRDLEWEKRYYTYATVAHELADGGYIVGGAFYHYNGPRGEQAFWVFKLDSAGKTTWRRVWSDWGVGSNVDLRDVRQVYDGGYLVSGEVSDAQGSLKAFIVRLDGDGRRIWQKTFATSSYTDFNALLPLPDGGFLASGMTSPAPLEYVAYVARFDALCNLVWQKFFEHRNGMNIGLTHSSRCKDGGFILNGHVFTGVFSVAHPWILRLNSAGNVLWAAEGEFPVAGWGSVRQTTDGGFILGFVSGGQKWYSSIVKLSPVGKVVWMKEYGGGKTGYDMYTQQSRDGLGLVAVGTMYPQEGTSQNHDIVVLKLNAQGDLNQECGSFYRTLSAASSQMPLRTASISIRIKAWSLPSRVPHVAIYDTDSQVKTVCE